MSPPSLFTYPRTPLQRQHHPSGYHSYGGFKPWLRDEFVFRCVYCLEREVWYPNGDAAFSVEHLVAQITDPTLVCDYTNLAYACTRCNSARRQVTCLDPVRMPLGLHLELGASGLLSPMTNEGRELLDLLHLNDNPALKTRQKYLRILELKKTYPQDAEIDALYFEAFGYPHDMPDLRAYRPPGGNRLEINEGSCCRARRDAGTLDRIY